MKDYEIENLKARYSEALKNIPRVCRLCNRPIMPERICPDCRYNDDSMHRGKQEFFAPYFEWFWGRENEWEPPSRKASGAIFEMLENCACEIGLNEKDEQKK